MSGAWVKRLITGVVMAIVACAVLLFAGCSTGALQGKQCDDGQERAFAVLSGLLTTVMGLAIKLEALDGPGGGTNPNHGPDAGYGVQRTRRQVLDPDR